MKKIFQMPSHHVKRFQQLYPGHDGFEYPLHSATVSAMSAGLAPGSASPILLMNKRALGRIGKFLDEVDETGVVVKMNKWLGHIFTIATSIGVYGPESPLEKDVSLVEHSEYVLSTIYDSLINNAQ